MTALLLSVLLASAPHDGAPAPTPASPSRVAIWAQPVGTLVLGITSSGHSNPLLPPSRMLYLPLGASIAVADHVSLAFELTQAVGWFRSIYDPRPARAQFTQTFGSAGVMFSREGPLQGDFVQPKLLFVSSSEPDYGFDLDHYPGGNSLEWQLGVDAGHQLQAGPVYIAFVFGVSVGYCFNCGDGAPTSMLGPNQAAWGFPKGRSNHWVYGLNLNLLRLGGHF